MLLFRSIVVGMLAGCLLLLAQRPRPAVLLVPSGPQVNSLREGPRPTIIDVAPLVAPEELVRLVRLAPGEHIVDVNGAHVSGDLEAGALISRIDPRPERYVDLTVVGALGERRVLVLMH